jgi:flagellar hook-associated protein 1 FlgK
LQSVLDVSANSAIPSALNKLFQSFSSWSTQPDSANYRTAVINAAQSVATAIQQAAGQLTSLRASAGNDLQSTVNQINQDAAKIHDYNVAIARQSSPDAGLDAQLHNAIEDLSNLADVQVIPGNGGTVTVLLGGQTPLVIGDQLNTLSVQYAASSGAPNPSAPPNASIIDGTGANVTDHVSSGSLRALLSVRNDLIPQLAGGEQQAGDLNVLAKTLADTVNNLLGQGTTSNSSSQTGTPLFTYDASSATGIAASFGVTKSITPSQLAPADAGPPPVANGIALKLAGLDSDPAGQINGQSFTQFFGSLAARVGTQAQNADTGAAAQTGLVNQAKALRQQLSGVSIDEEAVRLIELQRSYQAASKVVSVVDQLTQTILDLVK